jgi:hypothetical protein
VTHSSPLFWRTKFCRLQKQLDGKIVVSPAKSATDDTEVRVETTMEWLLLKMEEQVRKMIDEKFTVVKTTTGEDLGEMKRNMGHLQRDMGHLHRAYAMRNIEDWVIKRIKSKLGMKQDDEVSHADVVEEFIATYRFGGVTTSDLKSVADSEERKTANSIIHISYPDQIDTLRTAWKYVRPVLTDDEALKYGRLMKFVEGDCAMQKK